MKNKKLHIILLLLLCLTSALQARQTNNGYALSVVTDSVTNDDNKNSVVQLRDHVIAGIKLDNAKQPRAALKEFEAGMKICERMQLLDRFADNGKHWIFLITLPMYVISAGIYDQLGETDEAIRYCRKSMAWLEYCDSVEIRERYAYEVCLIMMGHRRLDMAQSLLARTYRDAVQLGKHDDALMCAAFMLEVEDSKYATSPSDNPWVERGKSHYDKATQPEVKSMFLSFLHKAYLKANMTDKAQQLEQQVRQARAKGKNPFLLDNKVTPYDSAYWSDSRLIQSYRENNSEINSDSSLVADKEIKGGNVGGLEKIRYIYRQHNGQITVIGSILAIVILAFIAYAMRQRYLRRHSQEESEIKQNKRFLEGMEQERSRLAKELHDGVSNQLFAIEMKLGDDNDAEQARRMITESREQVRRVSHELMPPEFTHTHLGEVIEDYMREMDGTAGCAMHFESSVSDDRYRAIPPEHSLEIYRIVQEAVVNAVKHSNASDIYVVTQDDGDTMTIRITDNCKDNGTSDIQGSHGIGWRTMSQRAALVGGTLTISRTPYGTVVMLRYIKKA